MKTVERLVIDSECEAWELPIVGADAYARTMASAKNFVAIHAQPGGPLAQASDHDLACWTAACIATSLLAPQAEERGVEVNAMLTRFVDRAPMIAEALAKAVYVPSVAERQFADGKDRIWTVPPMWTDRAEAAMQQATLLTKLHGSDAPPNAVALCHLLLDEINTRGIPAFDFVESMRNPDSIKVAARALFIACGILPSVVDSLEASLQAGSVPIGDSIVPPSDEQKGEADDSQLPPR